MRGTWLILSAAMLAAPAALVGCAGAQTVGQRVDDDVLTTRVAARIAADPEVRKYNVDVDTINGIVTLRGEVPEAADKMEAEEIALNTEGVLGVRNQLKVQKEGFGENVREGVSDAWIKTKVGSQLAADPDVRRHQIDVDVVDGVVTLSGTVTEAEDRIEAEEIARRTDGVKKVVNELSLKGGTEQMEADEAEQMEADEERRQQQRRQQQQQQGTTPRR